MQDKYSEILMLILVSTAMLVVCFILVIFFLMFNQKKKILYRQELEHLKNKYEQEILRSQLEIQEQTFRNLSEEIHDNIGQVLSLVKLNIVTMDLASPVALQQKIDDSRVMIGKAIKDLRDLSKGLNTDYIAELGFERAVEHEVAMIRKTGFYEAGIHVHGDAYRVHPQQELIMFRIVQEALNNIMKHAKANRIDIVLEYHQDNVRVTIRDNGKGFVGEKGHTEEPTGNGMKNMKHRATLIGATLHVKSIVGKGTTIFLELPQYQKVFETAHVQS